MDTITNDVNCYLQSCGLFPAQKIIDRVDNYLLASFPRTFENLTLEIGKLGWAFLQPMETDCFIDISDELSQCIAPWKIEVCNDDKENWVLCIGHEVGVPVEFITDLDELGSSHYIINVGSETRKIEKLFPDKSMMPLARKWRIDAYLLRKSNIKPLDSYKVVIHDYRLLVDHVGEIMFKFSY